MKNYNNRMKNVLIGFLNTLDTAEERLSKLEDMSIETSKTKMQRERNNKKDETECPKLR